MLRRFYVGTRKGLFAVDRDGKGATPWRIARAAFAGDHVPMLLPGRGGEHLLASLHHGHFGEKMHRSTDGGATWRETAVPTYPPKPEGVEDLDPFKRQPLPGSLLLVWALESGTPDPEGRLWDLVRSLWDHPDRRKHWFGGGADWPGIHSIFVVPRDGNHLTLGVSCGGVWVTRDGGETWEQRAHGMRAAYLPEEQSKLPDSQDPNPIRQCLARPDALWCQHHNGIFKSTAPVPAWTEIEKAGPSTFGFAVAVHPKDPDTAFFVPGIKDEKRLPVDGRLVVTRTTDGGRTFDVLDRGLPREHAYDVVYRHGLDIDAGGEILAFGSTTGNLWVSEDRGESWAQVSANLPPIYCVRFAR